MTNLKPANTLPYEVTLVWEEPTVNAQEVIGYTIVYTGRKQNEEPHDSEHPVVLSRGTTRYRFERLIPGYTYRFQVNTVTS